MGNGVGKMTMCFTGAAQMDYVAPRQRRDMAASMLFSDDLGHSFCYIRPELTHLSSSKVLSETDQHPTTAFKSISGAAVSANTAAPLSTVVIDLHSYNNIDRASVFEASTTFSSIPLQPIPINSSVHSGPLFNSDLVPSSGSLERGFMSSPFNRGMFSGPLEKSSFDQFQRSYSHGGSSFSPTSRNGSLVRALWRALSKGIYRGQNSTVAPIKGGVAIKESDWMINSEKMNELTVNSSEFTLDGDDPMVNQNVQWAQGKAGEDRVHVVISEDDGWVFVGIYDGFNGPDAPDYLLSNLYPLVHKELKALVWDENLASDNTLVSNSLADIENTSLKEDEPEDSCPRCVDQVSNYCTNSDTNNNLLQRRKRGRKYRGAAKRWEENQRRWRCEWEKERLELDRRLKEQFNRNMCNGSERTNHRGVLKALSQALKKTEEGFLVLADKMVMENPELALMGSCVLVMLMRGEDLYVMNVGDSRAVLAQTKEPDLWSHALDRINEETPYDLEAFEGCFLPSFSAIQLSMDHTTFIKEEVVRIKNEHPDDVSAAINDRVKGSLKVTRALGAGFLKQSKWNNALLEMFRIEYIGASPYINCVPSLYHHRLGPRDRFLVLSSGGLYQFFTNQEAVSEVELFVSLSPEGDPAQHLVEELLFCAAKRAGMDFHELLEVPVGDRRRYHDDVSIIVVSLEGRIWRSSA